MSVPDQDLNPSLISALAGVTANRSKASAEKGEEGR